MRVLETLIIMFAAIYVAQLLIAVLVLATMMLFLLTLWKRPREALMLGLAVLAIVFVSRPIGMALVTVIAVGCVGWILFKGWRARRQKRECCIRARLPRF